MKIIAISVDPKEESAKLKSELRLSFPLLSDEDEQVIKRYGLLHKSGNGGADIARPATLLLDKEGVVRWAAYTESVNARPLPEAILQAANELR